MIWTPNVAWRAGTGSDPYACLVRPNVPTPATHGTGCVGQAVPAGTRALTVEVNVTYELR